MLSKVNHKHLVKEWLFTFTIHSQIIMEIKKKRHLQVLCPPNAWILLTLSYRIKYVDGSYLIYKELGKKTLLSDLLSDQCLFQTYVFHSQNM